MKIFKYLTVIICFTALISCSEEYLDRPDLDNITTDSFWKTANDLNLYITQYYTAFPGWSPGAWNGGIYWSDSNSDNMSHFNINNRLHGNNTIDSGNGSWNFGNIRTVNIFLSKYQEVVDQGVEFDAISQYVGEGFFFRAYFYFNLVRNYGDVPWVSEPIFPDSEALYDPRTPRNLVVDNILADLDKAIEYMPSGQQNNGNRLCKEIAELFKARVALYEGTWEKYHAGTAFAPSSSDPNKYLQIATNSAQNLINNPGGFGIFSSGDIWEDYRVLFNQVSYASNNEVMLWRAFDVSLGLAHNGQRYLPRIGGGRGLSKHLIDQYLCTDGSPTSTSGLYQGDQGLDNVSANRDPRLSQTVFLPGHPMRLENGVIEEAFEQAPLTANGEEKCPTGYMIYKGSNPDPNQYFSGGVGTTSSPVFRFSEALLILAEAKAELGTITQVDVDNTINKLRDRVGMPHLNVGGIANDPNWAFPTLSPIINEIRRERQVEFAAEGYRFDDIMRWAAADELIAGKRVKGIYFQQSDFPDAVIGTDVILDDDGYVDPLQGQAPSGFGFNVNRDYLLAVPQQELTLNPSLNQNPGWE